MRKFNSFSDPTNCGFPSLIKIPVGSFKGSYLLMLTGFLHKIFKECSVSGNLVPPIQTYEAEGSKILLLFSFSHYHIIYRVHFQMCVCIIEWGAGGETKTSRGTKPRPCPHGSILKFAKLESFSAKEKWLNSSWKLLGDNIFDAQIWKCVTV